MPEPLPNPFNQLATNLGKQGDTFNKPLSDSNQYYGFLSKADQDWETGLWDVLFEVLPAEWAANALARSGDDVNIIAPIGPASLYHLPAVDQNALLQILGLKTTDDLAEGSWYLLQLEKQDKGTVNGMLYDPDIDMEPNT